MRGLFFSSGGGGRKGYVAEVDRIFNMRTQSSMYKFTVVPHPQTTPRIEARKNTNRLEHDYNRFMVLFWEFFNNLNSWRETVEQRLTTIESKLPR